ncbi:MAG: imidazole glycerol phosphate synthase subunit HisH [bacterium]
MQVAIVDYDAGNLRSVQRACHKVGIDAYITADPEKVIKADKVVFPGVGSAVSAIDTLHQRGLFEALSEVFHSGKPFLGICLGSQIVLNHTEEGDKDCLSLVDGVCERFDFADRVLKIPHMGWNEVVIQKPHPLLRNVKSGDEFYFVHSYFIRPTDKDTIVAVTQYKSEFCSILAKDNLFATQFHLEKSGEKGLHILQAFGKWDGGDVC